MDFAFQGSKSTLSGRISHPDSQLSAVAVFAHCFTCSKEIPAVKRITSRLSHHGIAVMSFDFTGLGHSHGNFADTNFSTNVLDLKLAIEHLKSIGMAPTLLIGHSLGGAAVLQVASELFEIQAVVTIGAPSNPKHLEKLLAGHIAEIAGEGEAKVSLANREFVIKEQFLKDIQDSEILTCVRKMKAALLILHAPLDNTVGIENAEEIFRAAQHPKSFVSLDDADHLLKKVRDSEYVADIISSWSSRYLNLRTPKTSPNSGDGPVLVSEVAADKFQQDILFGQKHTLLADYPTDFGGLDTGPTPYQLIAAALGACTSITIRIYAKRNKIPLVCVSVEVTQDKRHAEVDPEGIPTYSHFLRKIRLTGPLTSEQRESLIAIANKCPIQGTLEAISQIETIDVSLEARPPMS
ncbi:bifunctional alpha/beta hydrolase/OsmC family protein [Candidatus Aquiluna sp. UB-MaderosW2red]|uniref:bifunctional alpha/beta hydrolase/OsmC family protein n=1 Tax=Candidatus Aquiluna sp. UB-MaderosW2red TaxID=1855377 RepID=UPI0018D3C4CB|nr:bifunctional alpha/beta hydrolase/OsmC family protein [Candidatus Aquiluna sp. UB-MaderosW2red]